MNNMTQGQVTKLPFQFNGQAGEYFRIWIVNVFLTIVTLGIYSAWAKVRTNRYFYGSTELDKAHFEYLASPIPILKGRVIAAAVFAIYYVATEIDPRSGLIFMPIFLLLLPWLIVRAMSFRNRNTSYRNLRFDFQAGYGRSMKIFVGGILLTIVTLGIAYPYMLYLQTRFIIGSSLYGKTPVTFHARVGQFYEVIAKSFIIYLLLFGIIGVVGAVLGGSLLGVLGGSGAELGKEEMARNGMLIQAVIMPFFIAAYLIAYAYYQARIGNLVFNNIRIGKFQLQSELRTGKLTALYFVNGLAIVVSLGLLIPWAKVRTSRYRLSVLTIIGHGSVEDFVAGELQAANATGEGFADVFDVDIGL